MRRRLIGAALAALSLAVVPAVTASATGGSGTSVSINQYADFNFNGTQLDVGLQVRCSGGSGLAMVDVDQYYPETPNPLGAHGTGIMEVVCDGQTHNVGVTVVGVVFDAGKAKAKATVIAPSGTATTTRWIVIRVV